MFIEDIEEFLDTKTYRGSIAPSWEEQLILDDLMRRQSSCKRFAYKRLLEGYDRNYLKRTLQAKFDLNSRYVDDAIADAQAAMDAMLELGEDPKKIVWGSRELFEKLNSKYLSSERLTSLRESFRESRQLNLYSRGDSALNGNPNIKIEIEDANIILRVNIGNRKWLKLPYSFEHKNHAEVLFAIMAGFPYTMRITCRDGNYQVMPTVSQEFPKPIEGFTKVMGIDLNAFPVHIAWTIAAEDGNPLQWGKLPMPELFDQRSNKRDAIEWEVADKVTELALLNKCRLAAEKLKLPRAKRGSRKSRHTRRKLNNFPWKSLLEKIIILAKRKGLFVTQVKPYDTSTIGKIKYAPLFGMSGHNGAALVIARRALGFSEKIPKRILKIKNDYGKELLLKEEEKVVKRKAKIKELSKKIADLKKSGSDTTKRRRKLSEEERKKKEKSFRSSLRKARIHLGKEEARVIRLSYDFPKETVSPAAWRVTKIAVPTALSTGGKDKLRPQWGRLNPSTLRGLLFQEGYSISASGGMESVKDRLSRGNYTNVAAGGRNPPAG
jgi:IS605 OrfB family transposase